MFLERHERQRQRCVSKTSMRPNRRRGDGVRTQNLHATAITLIQRFRGAKLSLEMSERIAMHAFKQASQPTGDASEGTVVVVAVCVCAQST